MTALRILKLLFCFKKPGIIQLSYIHVLVKNKPAFFIVWDIKNVWWVKLHPITRRYYDAQKALVLAMPQEQQQLTLKAANFWRRKRITLTLHAVALDEAAAAQLIQGFRPLSRIEVAAPLISNISNKAVIKPAGIRQKNTCIKKIDRFNIHIQHINYH